MSLQEKSLFMAMELSNKKWRLAFGDGAKVRERVMPARCEDQLVHEVAVAKAKLGLSEAAPVICCYEAGRDGFWIARMLEKHGFENHVMDPASIEVPRRARTRKTDRLDARRLLKLLVRSRLGGERDAFSAVRVPSEEQESAMRPHRERERLVKERTGHRARMRSLCALQGIGIGNPATVVIEQLHDWEGKALAEHVAMDLQREQQRLVLVEGQLKALEQQQESALLSADNPSVQKACKMARLKGVGLQSSWLLAHECFGWRTFANRKQVGAFAGLTGTPFDSGDSLREQGISKAGSGRVRTTMIELAWGWVRWQPTSALSRWFIDRCMRQGAARSKRKAIVALARKLLVALWKYVEQDLVPEGAILKA